MFCTTVPLLLYFLLVLFFFWLPKGCCVRFSAQFCLRWSADECRCVGVLKHWPRDGRKRDIYPRRRRQDIGQDIPAAAEFCFILFILYFTRRLFFAYARSELV